MTGVQTQIKTLIKCEADLMRLVYLQHDFMEISGASPPKLGLIFRSWGGGWLGGVPQTKAFEANSKTLSSGCHVGVSRLTRGKGSEMSVAFIGEISFY